MMESLITKSSVHPCPFLQFQGYIKQIALIWKKEGQIPFLRSQLLTFERVKSFEARLAVTNCCCLFESI